MARLGRGVPHQPIFIRGAIAAAVVAVAAPQVHVVQAPRTPSAARSTSSAVIFLRTREGAPEPVSGAPQLHVIHGKARARYAGRNVNVYLVRNAAEPPAPPPFVRPKIIVITVPGRHTEGAVIRVRNPAAQPDFDDRGPGQQVVQQRSSREATVHRDVQVVFVRSKIAGPPPSAIGESNVVVVQAKLRVHDRHYKNDVIFLRNRAEAVPVATGESVVLVVHGRARAQHPARDVNHVTVLRAPSVAAAAAAPPAVRVHVIQPERRATGRVARVVRLRAPVELVTTQFIDPPGIASAEAFGSFSITMHINPGAIASAEAFGSFSITMHIDPAGISTGEAFGSFSIALHVNPAGVASAEAFGTPLVEISTALLLTPEAIILFGRKHTVRSERVGKIVVPKTLEDG